MSTASKNSTTCEKESTDPPVLISSYLALLKKGDEEKVVSELNALTGVEVHGSEHGFYVVSIEAGSIDETYRLATEITQKSGVTSFNLVHFNFEDESIKGNEQQCIETLCSAT